MQSAIASLACLLALSPSFSAQPANDAAAMKKAKFLVGSFKGNSVFTMGAQMVNAPTTAKGSLTMGGRFYEVNFTYEIAGMATDGKAMISYDSAMKVYNGWSFNSQRSDSIRQEGRFVGDSLVLVTKAGDEMNGRLVRTSWKPTSKGIQCTVETKSGDDWTTMAVVDLTKE
jgi:hypothetical protein